MIHEKEIGFEVQDCSLCCNFCHILSSEHKTFWLSIKAILWSSTYLQGVWYNLKGAFIHRGWAAHKLYTSFIKGLSRWCWESRRQEILFTFCQPVLSIPSLLRIQDTLFTVNLPILPVWHIALAQGVFHPLLQRPLFLVWVAAGQQNWISPLAARWQTRVTYCY